MERVRARASSIELVLDAAGEEAVRREWAALEAAGLSSVGAHRAPSNRPHVTLLAAPGLPVPRLQRGSVPRLAPALPIALRLGLPALLPGDGERRVLARALERTDELLALRAAVVAALAAQEAGAATPADARRAAAADAQAHPALDRQDGRADDASAWLPHVTLAKRLRASELPLALALLGGRIDATAVGIRHWDPEAGRSTSVADA